MPQNNQTSDMHSDFKSYIVNRVFPEGTYEDLLTFPKYFEMETVNACNAKCTMCPLPGTYRKPMSDQLFSKISQEIIQHSKTVKRVSLYRDGEPLLDPKLANRIHTFKDGGIKRVGISTNISLLDRKKAEAVLHAGIDEVILSIDSLNKTVFESIRLGLTFETVLKNALNFIDLRNKLRPETQIWVRMIRQKSNRDEWDEFREFWKEKLCPTDRVNFRNIHNWGGQLEDSEQIASNTEEAIPCIALWSLMPIFSDGSVPLCNVDFQLAKQLGNLKDQSIKDIWTSHQLNSIRQSHLNKQKHKIKICKDCNAWTLPSDLMEKNKQSNS